MVKDNGIGPGAIIELSRSGEVIPKIEQVITAVEPQIPAVCPSCGAELFWDNDYLRCPDNMGCPAQITNAIEHFFRTLANIDGFGPATIKKLYDHDIKTVSEIYQLTVAEFAEMGFGPRQSENLVNQLLRSRVEQIEDWRFLAAFGIYRLGPGNCEKLLAVYSLEKVLHLSEEEIVVVEGFAELTARAVCLGLKLITPLFNDLYQLGFNLEKTRRTDKEDDSPIKGKLIVFTGKMAQGSRSAMEKQAKSLGARTGKSITGKTDLLVTGAKVGAAKLKKAQENNIKIISEEEYLKIIGK
jgi:DNA ligase (NAD+)